MHSHRVTSAFAGGLAASALLAVPALAAPAAQNIQSGTPISFQVPASPSGFYQTWTLNYPGDGSNLTVDAELGGFDPSQAGTVGFNVYDAQHPGAAVEVANTQTDQKSNDPNGIEFNYSSGFAGPVQIQFFDTSTLALTVTVAQSGLQPSNGGAANPVTLTAQGAPAAAPATRPAAAPAAAAPAGSPAPGASVPAGQPVNFSAPAQPGGFFRTITFNYPGDNSNVTFDAELNNFDVSQAGAAGFNVFDAQHQASPVEVADTKSDQKPNDPHGIEFNYSSGTAGTVSVQFFSYAPSAVSVSLTDGGLVSTSGATTPLTLSA